MPAARVTVHLTPRSARNEALAYDGETLRVRVTAPPVDGRANDALLRLLAEQLDVPRGAVRIVSGHSGRQKVVEVDGLTAAQLRLMLADG